MAGAILRIELRLLAAFLGLAALAAPLQPARAETRSYVVGWFTQATSSVEGDCPDGLNPLPEMTFRRDLTAIGMKKKDVEKILSGFSNGFGTPETTDALVNRGRVDGKPVNAYNHPMAVPDARLSTVVSNQAYGFNLDGKGAASPNSFVDPETGESGVDNQYWRAMGCHIHHRAAATDLPAYWSMVWGILRDSMPAWLMSIEGADLSRDGDVTVTFEKALEHITRDANGYVVADTTFRRDPDPRWRNVLRGTMKDGTVTVQDGEVHLAGDLYMLARLDLHSVRLRLNLTPDGGADGMIGGYVPWRSLYFMYANSGVIGEGMVGIDIPGIYHSLRRLADANPDPRTGQNLSISTAFRIRALPAFIVAADPLLASGTAR